MFYVDGFNFYHALIEVNSTRTCKWLDLARLCRSLIAPDEQLVGVKYFTARPFWNPEKSQRQQTYINALESSGVTVVWGRFNKVQLTCQVCGSSYWTHEEKETDVNLSARVIRDGLQDAYDTAYLVTGDSDQVPTFKAVKLLASRKRLVAVFPVNRHLHELKNVADRSIQLKPLHFTRNLFPDVVALPSGRTIVKPRGW